MDRPAKSLYQLNDGRVFWVPYKQLRVNGVHPIYRWLCHRQCIDQNTPPNPIRHVKRPTDRFARFDNKQFPSSKFTNKGKVDTVMYHPLYNGFRPKGTVVNAEPLDMTWTFYPPENQGWYKSVPNENNESSAPTGKPKSQSKTTRVINTTFDTEKMRPYLSPIAESYEREIINQYHYTEKWGSYRSDPAIKNKRKNSSASTKVRGPVLKPTTSIEMPQVKPSTSKSEEPTTPIKIPIPEAQPFTSNTASRNYVISPSRLRADDAGSKELLITLFSSTDCSRLLIATTWGFPKHLFNLQRCTIFVFLEQPSAYNIAFTLLNISVTR